MHLKPHRFRRSILRAAPLGLLLAFSLVLFANFGGEDAAKSLIEVLAGRSALLQRIVCFDLAIPPAKQVAVSPPRTTAAKAESATPAESSPAPEQTSQAEEENLSPLLPCSGTSSGLAINNETSYSVSAAQCLASPISILNSSGQPTVLIVHTHGSEAYLPDSAFPYTPTEFERTTDNRFNVVRVGDELQKVLLKNGIETIHCRKLFDTPVYEGSYDRALAEIEQELNDHPSIQLVIDVHRDSILTEDGTAYQSSCTIGGEQAAQIMFVVGTDDGGLTHENWRDNLRYVVGLQQALTTRYPTLMRPINLRTQRFNQHMRTGSMLIEVGASGNTLGEALCAVRLFGSALALQLNDA